MHVFRRKCSRQMNAVCQNKTGAIWQLDVTRLYAILIGSNRPSFVRERCIPFSLAFVTKNNASKEIRGKHRKNNLETWRHKNILHFNWPQLPKVVFLKGASLFHLHLWPRNTHLKKSSEKMRQNDLAAWCHKTICHFNWPQPPKFCSWKMHLFFTSVCDQKQCIVKKPKKSKKNLETWCHKTILHFNWPQGASLFH